MSVQVPSCTTPDSPAEQDEPSQSAEASETSRRELDITLAEMRASFESGDLARAGEIAQTCLSRSVEGNDVDAEAWASHYLAMCDWRSSKIRRANDTAQRAAHLFRQSRNIVGEARALTVLTYTASTLGRHEEAIEAGLLAERLTALTGLEQLRPAAMHYLGRAYSKCQRYDKAEEAFRESFASATRVNPHDASTFQTHLAVVNGELVRLVQERTATGILPPLSRLVSVSEAAQAHLKALGDSPLLEGMTASVASRIDSYLAILAVWQGDIELARALIAQANNAAHRHHGATWLRLMIAWAQAEALISQREDGEAIEVLQRAILMAQAVEHESFVDTLNSVLIHVHELRGDYASAMSQCKMVRQREVAIRSEALVSRERIAQWHVDGRHRENMLSSLETESRRLARLTVEDTLTGLTNRRGFEERLAQELTMATQQNSALSVAFIDVDRFKAINDGFSHAVGDRVLVEIALILTGAVREGDFVARLAGDEFVILFARTDASVATQACDRIAEVVAGHDWSLISPGLRVSISIGVAQSVPGDSSTDLVHRSDVSMYERKRAVRRPEDEVGMAH